MCSAVAFQRTVDMHLPLSTAPIQDSRIDIIKISQVELWLHQIAEASFCVYQRHLITGQQLRNKSKDRQVRSISFGNWLGNSCALFILAYTPGAHLSLFASSSRDLAPRETQIKYFSSD